MSIENVLDRMALESSVELMVPMSDENGEPVYDDEGNIVCLELPLVVSDDSYRYRTIMGEHALHLKFSLPGYAYKREKGEQEFDFEGFPIGTYCDYQGQRYTLETPENIKKNGEADYEYNLVLQSDQYKLSKFMLRNNIEGDTRLKFSYTARPEEFLRLLVDNMNSRYEDADGNVPEDLKWSFGDDYVEAYEKVVSFNHNTCAEALQMIAEAFETEWEVIGRVISLRKVEYNKEDPLKLSYGKDKGFLPGLGRSEYSEAKPVERLFVQGGSRNIDPSTYRKENSTGQIVSRELLMPAGVRIKFDGTNFDDDIVDQGSANVREYITDQSGASVINSVNEGRRDLLEGSLDASGVYPMREGTVSAVEEMTDGWDFWDSSIPEGLDYSSDELRIAGETAAVIFQSGMLAGKEFEIMQTDKKITGYIHKDPEHPGDPARKRGRFKLKSQEIDGIMMPEASCYYPRPKSDGYEGDRYAVFHIGMPETYIEEAERNMLKEAVRYLYDNETPRLTFTGTLDSIWAKRRWKDIGGLFMLGSYIHFSDPQFLPEGMDIRITGIKDYVNNRYKPQIELSNNSKSGSWVHNMKRQIESDEVLTETRDREIVQFAKRRFRDVKETTDMLQKSMLDFTESINPVTVNTMLMLVGEDSMQFEYDSESANPFQFVPEDEMTFHAAKGTLTHKTIQNNGDYLSWEMPAGRITPDDPDKGYFLYAKVEKPGVTNPDRRFLIDETAKPVNGDPNYYYLLVGILNSEYDRDRSFAPLYGFTEILPGRITTDKIVSSDGNTYFDLTKEIEHKDDPDYKTYGEIGGRINFADGLVTGEIGIGNGSEVRAGMNGEGDSDTDVRIWAGATAANKTSAPFMVQQNGAITASNARITGELNATKGTFKNVTVEGSVAQPWVLWSASANPNQFQGDSQGLSRYDNIAMPTTSDISLSATQFSWRVADSGRVIRICQYRWNNAASSYNAIINAPSGKYFFENGKQYSSLRIARELITLVGYGTASTFYGWIVQSRTLVMPSGTYGAYRRVLYQGYVYLASSTNYEARIWSADLELGHAASEDWYIERVSQGRYRVGLPISLSSSYFQVYLHPTITNYAGSSVVADTTNGTYACVTKKGQGSYGGIYRSYFEVWTADDALPNDSAFMFEVVGTYDWRAPSATRAMSATVMSDDPTPVLLGVQDLSIDPHEVDGGSSPSEVISTEEKEDGSVNMSFKIMRDGDA